MTHFDEIYELAADNYGIITTSEAHNLGITNAELKRWVDAGRLQKRGRGVYKIKYYIPTLNDRFAEAVALVGKGSFLAGETVLAFHDLALVNPQKLTIGTSKRVRKKLPAWIEVVPMQNKTLTCYEGLPSQTITEAILDCRHRVMNERLKEAVRDARREGLITKDEYSFLKRTLA